MKKILTALLAGLVAAGSFATVSSAAIAKLEEAPGDALAQFEDGTIVWIANSGFAGETADNLFDEDPNTKWCHGDAYSYVVWELPEAVSITGYQIVTASDNEAWPGRNPGDFVLYGCNDYNSDIDDGSWEAIDTVEDSVAEGLQDLNWTAFTFTDFDVAEVPAYKYYMFEINSVVGGGIMQMSGFNLVYEGKEAAAIDADAIAAQAAAEAAAAIAEAYATYEAECANYTYPSSGIAVADGSVLIDGARIGDVVGWGNNGAAGTFAAFDGNPASFFDPTTKAESYCGIDAGEEMILTNIAIQSRESFLNRFNGARIQGSNDLVTWTDVFASEADAAAFAIADFSDQIIAENNTGYRYFRYFNEAIEGDVAEVELYGYAKDGTNPEYTPFVFRAADYTTVSDAEEVVEETEAVVEETEAVVEETEAVVEETEATVEETEATVEETEATEEVVETVETKEETTAPQTFDAVIIAGVAAVVSLAGYAVSKKH